MSSVLKMDLRRAIVLSLLLPVALVANPPTKSTGTGSARDSLDATATGPGVDRFQGAPGNDECWDANVIAFTMDETSKCIQGSSDDTQDEEDSLVDVLNCGGTPVPNHGIWYRIDGVGEGIGAGEPTFITVSTCETCQLNGTAFDTSLQVYCTKDCLGTSSESYCCKNRLVCLGGNDDTAGSYDSTCDVLGKAYNHGSTLSWCADPNASYHILVGGAAGGSGDFELQITRDLGGRPCEPPADAPVCEGIGACCDGETCKAEDSFGAPMTESNCYAIGGTFYWGLSCHDVDCLLSGACCALWGGPDPDDRICLQGSVNDPYDRSWRCAQVPESRFYPGESCPTFQCPECGDEHWHSTYEECDASDPDDPNRSICDQDCKLVINPGVCPSLTGACCLSHAGQGCDIEECCMDVCAQDPYCCNVSWDDSCAEIAARTAACTGQDCVGACCDGAICTETLSDNCAALGYVFAGAGTACATSPCSTGACCDATGTCSEVSGSASCIGNYLGDGTRCDPNRDSCLGACCDGTDCSVTIAADCIGTFQGEETRCEPDTCFPPTPPANDECTGAELLDISSGSATVYPDNTTATKNRDGVPGTDIGDPLLYCHWGGNDTSTHEPPAVEHTLWYKFVAPASGNVHISTCQTGSGEEDAIDTIVGLFRKIGSQSESVYCTNVYQGTEELDCFDDGCGEPVDSNSIFHTRFCYAGLEAGQTYYIMLGTSAGREIARPGKITLTVSTDVSGCGVCCNIYNDSGGACSTVRRDGSGSVWAQHMFADQCEAMLGTFVLHMARQDCAQACQDEGACCGCFPFCNAATGAFFDCSEETEADCINVYLGTYLGDDTTCPANCAPVNDHCVGGAANWDLTCGSNRIDSNLYATPPNAALIEIDEPMAGCRQASSSDMEYGSIWYNFVVPAGVNSARISTCNSDLDTILTIFKATDCDNLGNEVACSDDDCGLASEVCLTGLVESDKYIIRVSSWSPESQGDIAIQIDCDCTDETNDACAAASTLSIPDTVMHQTLDATVDVVPECGGFATAPGVWYKITGNGKILTADTCDQAGTDFDTKLSVFCGECSTLECVATNDDDESCPDARSSKVSWCSESGRDYWILVHGFGDATGNFTLDVTSDDPNPCNAPACGVPSNDACTQALTVSEETVPYSNIGTDTDGAAHPGDCQYDGQTHQDIWYEYNATNNGNLTVSVCESANYDTDVVVYDGCDCATMSRIACNDDSPACAAYTSQLVARVLSAKCYKIRVGGHGPTDAGTGTLTLECPMPVIEDIELFHAGKFNDDPDPTCNFLANGSSAGLDNISNNAFGITGLRIKFDGIVDFASTVDAAFSFDWTFTTGTTFSPVPDVGNNFTITTTDEDGKTIVEISITANYVRQRWLKVSLDATQVTACGYALDGELTGNPLDLPAGNGSAGGDAVFYIGSMPGDVTEDRKTNLTDVGQIRLRVNPALLVPVTNHYDIDKSEKVLLGDVGRARLDVNPAFALPLIAP